MIANLKKDVVGHHGSTEMNAPLVEGPSRRPEREAVSEITCEVKAREGGEKV
jgi:hypothetical protein